MAVHETPHPLAGQVVKISDGVTDPAQSAVQGGAEFKIGDWWDRISGRTWGEQAQRNQACIHYAMRAAANLIPPDDEVLYGKIGYLVHLVHVSEINW